MRNKERVIKNLEKDILEDYLTMTDLNRDDKEREKACVRFLADQRKYYAKTHRHYLPSSNYVRLKR